MYRILKYRINTKNDIKSLQVVDYTRKVERNITSKMSKKLPKLPKKHQNEQTADTYIELCRWNIKRALN